MRMSGGFVDDTGDPVKITPPTSLPQSAISSSSSDDDDDDGIGVSFIPSSPPWPYVDDKGRPSHGGCDELLWGCCHQRFCDPESRAIA